MQQDYISEKEGEQRMTPYMVRYFQKQREMCRENDLCIWCKSPAPPGKMLCVECRKKHTERTRKLRESRKAAGMCVICGTSPAQKGRTQCLECAVRSSEAARKSYYKRKAEKNDKQKKTLTDE